MSTIAPPNIPLRELMASVYSEGKCLTEMPVPLPLIIGRQNPETGEPNPFHIVPASISTPAKFIVEKFQRQSSLSRAHVQLVAVGAERVRVTNVGKNPVAVNNTGQMLQGGQHLDVNLPLDLSVGAIAITLKSTVVNVEDLSNQGFETVKPALHSRSLHKGKLASLLQTIDRQLASELLECLQDVLMVLQEAASEADFFSKAAHALRSVVGMQNAAVMLYKDGVWRPQTIVTDSKDEEWRPSRGALSQLLVTRATLRSKGAADTQSIQNVSCLVVSPILNADGEILGALYGDRREALRTSGNLEVSEVEGMLADMLASAVATGITRLGHEQKAVANRVRLEQFFTPVLARELESNDQLMRCKETEVTCLVCDVRGFSGVSERCGPTVTLEWLSDVMERLGRCVINSGGVLVDQIGDEFLAMWGAPDECADHAARAIRALNEMLRVAPLLSSDWEERIKGETAVGIGLNSGTAVVGNTGSALRFRYAPLGDTVNLASRLQGTTKYFKVQSIISDSTAQSCPPELRRRLGRIKVVNRDSDTNVFEYNHQIDKKFLETKQRYEEALTIFEAGDFRAAIQRLGGLLSINPDDGPTLLLLSRSYAALTQGADKHHPVWTLPGK